MIKTLLVGLPMMAICLLVQVAASYWAVRNYARRASQLHPRSGLLVGSLPLLVAMLVMLLGNIVQIAVWGAVFLLLGEFQQLHDAVYHSAVNFASLGYGDVVMSERWKLLGPIEALNGVLMLGMTGAALMAIVQNMISRHAGGSGHEHGMRGRRG